MGFPGRGTHITSDMGFPGRGTHITSDMGFPGRGTHITRDMCFSGGGTHITSDMQWFEQYLNVQFILQPAGAFISQPDLLHQSS